jgi:CheY-like chemotaxis protein
MSRTYQYKEVLTVSKIFVVNENYEARSKIVETLRRAFPDHSATFEIEEVTLGIDALEIERDAHLILLDWVMFAMTGLEVFQVISSLGPPIVVVSSLTDNEFNEAKGSGVKTIIREPYTTETFRTVLGPILGIGKKA